MTRRLFPWVWTALIAMACILLLLFGDIGTGPVDVLTSLVSASAIVLMAAFGSIISSRQPGNRIAWLFHLISVGLLVVIPASEAIDAIDPASPDFPKFRDYMSIFIIEGLSGSILLAVFLLLFIFPTGRFLTRSWRWAGWISAVFVPAYFLAVVFSEEFVEQYTDQPSWRIPNPIGFLPRAVNDFMTLMWLAILMAVAVGGVVAMVVRYRRSGVLVRTQIKWVIFAAAVATVSLPIGFGDSPLAELFLTASFFLIPVAITLAITRYKLYEIDRIISRTIGYTLVVVLLAGVYVALIIVGGSFLPSENPLVVAASTLAVAALFNPLRKRIQQAVDRRFNRSRYQAEVIAEEFASSLREPLSSREIVDLWGNTVHRAVEPEDIRIWLRST